MDPIFDLMDLTLARNYQAAIFKDDLAALELWKFQNTYQGSTRDLEATRPGSYRDLEELKIRSALGIVSAAQDWHAWRLAWSRYVP